MSTPDSAKPHTERWAYRSLYRQNIFEWTTRLYPALGRTIYQAISRSVAWFYARTQPIIRGIVEENLRLLGPASTRDAVKVFVNFGATIADYVAVGAMPKEDALDLCAEQVGLDYLKEAMRGGLGVILVTGHYGFFEFGPAVLSQHGCRTSIVTAPEPSEELTRWRANWRARWKTETIEVGADPFSSLAVTRALEAGRCVAMLADRPFGEKGIPVNLPNGRISFSAAPALISWMTGSPILPVLITRLDDGRYRITAKPPIVARRTSREHRERDLAECTEKIAEELMEEILRDPLQWYQFVPVGLGPAK